MASEIITTTVMEPNTHEREPEEPIKLNVSGRTVYAALKNLLVHHYKVTPESLIDRVTQSVDLTALVNRWLEGRVFGASINKMVCDWVAKHAAQLVRDEVRAMVNGKVKITIGEG